MSAYLVSKTHIDALVTAMLEMSSAGNASRATCREFREERDMAERLGTLLTRANVESVNYRYQDSRAEVRAAMLSRPEEHLPYRYELVPWCRATDPGWAVQLARALALLDCYEHQACEPPGWDQSEASEQCRHLRRGLSLELRKALGVTNLWSIAHGERAVYSRALDGGK